MLVYQGVIGFETVDWTGGAGSDYEAGTTKLLWVSISEINERKRRPPREPALDQLNTVPEVIQHAASSRHF